MTARLLPRAGPAPAAGSVRWDGGFGSAATSGDGRPNTAAFTPFVRPSQLAPFAYSPHAIGCSLSLSLFN